MGTVNAERNARVLELLTPERSYRDVAGILGMTRSQIAGIAGRAGLKKPYPADRRGPRSKEAKARQSDAVRLSWADPQRKLLRLRNIVAAIERKIAALEAELAANNHRAS
jgi:hypothetical protein